MGSFPQKYKNAAGDVVPSVTTILANLGWSAFGLKWWSFEQGKLAGRAGEMEKTIRDVQEKLADAGTLCHLFAQQDVQGTAHSAPPDTDPAVLQKAEDNFASYLSWKARTKLEIVAAEVRLVSEKCQYGGRPDGIVLFNGEPGLIDFKSSKELYPDTIAQLAAYSNMWDEVHPEMPLKHHTVLRWSPDGGFNEHSLSARQMEAGWKTFRCCMELNRLKKELKP